jgi:2-polyprenyl-3-methyl-5-hydroxy-6-metoxy-1,4-benzoquinol methylase
MFNIKEITKNSISFTYKNKEYTKEYKQGDDAIYINMDNNIGLKIIYPNAKYEIQEVTYNNLLKFKTKNYSFFPIIYDVNIHEDLILLELEHIHDNNISIDLNFEWIPVQDRNYIQNNISTDIDTLTNISYKMLQAGLNPEDEWYKKGKNLINNKIVDFHRFTYYPERYEMPTNAHRDTLHSVYTDALNRYSTMGINKWKGKIYEGYRFNNGEEFLGYSSDNQEYDSYRKLNFMSLNKCKGGNVLDIGCNEGFLSIQAALHGAESVYGFDITEQDIALAKDIKNKILKLDNVEFGVENGVEYVKNMNSSYNMIILSSVLHQIYPNMEGSEEFLSTISKNTKYMAYETPVNHPLMNIPLENIHQNLMKHFLHVRLTYVYNAYSSGYRATFICWHN